MAQDLTLQEVGIGDLATVVDSDLRTEGALLPKDVLLAAGKAISQIRGLTARVAVPKQVASAIARGELIRHGGVVRDRAGKLRLLLKSPSKLTTIIKSPIWMLLALDLAQSALLNAKLAEIQKELRLVHSKVDALLQSKLRAAFEDAAQLSDIRSFEHRTIRIHTALDRIAEAIPAAEKLLEDSILETEKAASKVETGGGFWRSAKSCFNEFEMRCKQVISSTIVTASLLALRARLLDELDEYNAASNTQRRLTSLILSVDGKLSPLLERIKVIELQNEEKEALTIPTYIGSKALTFNIISYCKNEITRHQAKEASARVNALRSILSQSSTDALIAHSTIRVLSI